MWKLDEILPNYKSQACTIQAHHHRWCYFHSWVRSSLCRCSLPSKDDEWIPRTPGPCHTDAYKEPQTQNHGAWGCALGSLFLDQLRVAAFHVPGPYKGYGQQFLLRSRAACILLTFSGRRPEIKSQYLRGDTQPERSRGRWIHLQPWPSVVGGFTCSLGLWWSKPRLVEHTVSGDPVLFEKCSLAVSRTHSLPHPLLAFFLPLPSFQTLAMLNESPLNSHPAWACPGGSPSLDTKTTKEWLSCVGGTCQEWVTTEANKHLPFSGPPTAADDCGFRLTPWTLVWKAFTI